MQPSKGYQALRAGRVSLSDQIYLLTTTTDHRRRLFSHPEIAHSACQVMQHEPCWRGSTLLCWVLMPDHWHGLLRLDEEDDLSRVMQRWKSIVTRNLRRRGIQGTVWAPGFHDRALRRDEDVLGAARYILANPVRAGLAVDVFAYPYWGSIWHEGIE